MQQLSKAKRGSSIQRQLQPTKILEQETKEMEDKIIALKKFMNEQKEKNEMDKTQSGTRWQAADTSKPIRFGYTSNVPSNKRQANSIKLKQPAASSTVKSDQVNDKSLNGSRTSFNSFIKTNQTPILKNINNSQARRNSSSIVLPKLTNAPQISSNTQSSKMYEQQNLSLDIQIRPGTANSDTSVQSEQVSSGSQFEEQQSERNIQSQKTSKNEKKIKKISLSQVLSTKLLKKGGNLTQNIQRALIKQIKKEQQNEVVQYLQRIGIPQYTGHILESGFDDMETLFDIQIQHLQELKIPPRDGKLLLRKLADFKRDIDQKEFEQTRKTEAPIINNSLLIGTFDEKESHNYFMEALLEFRGEGSQQAQIPDEVDNNLQDTKKSVRFDSNTNFEKTSIKKKGGCSIKYQRKGLKQKPQIDLIKQTGSGVEYFSSKKSTKIVQEDQPQKQSIFLFGGGSDWNNSFYPFDLDDVAQTEKMVPQKKESCWTCYKLIFLNVTLYFDSQPFCSEKCMKNYQSEKIYICKALSCGKVIEKDNSFYHFGLWFCNEECFEQQQWENQDIQKISSRLAGKQNIKESLDEIQKIDYIDLTLSRKGNYLQQY